MPRQSIEENCLTRWYIDTRQLTSTCSSLPLLETLQLSDQVTVKKFYHLADRHMSLASYLLKYYFIHSACRIPWNEITISRTPEPHRRPCFLPASRTRPDGTPIPNVEFNLSHQASLVALAGCIIPSSCSRVRRRRLPRQKYVDYRLYISTAILFTRSTSSPSGWN